MEPTKSNSRTFNPFYRQCFVTATIFLNTIGQGCGVGYTGVLLPQLSLPGSPIELSQNNASWIASIVGISMLVGNFVTPPIMGRFGRKVAMNTTSYCALVGWITIVLATNVEMLIIGRLLQGTSFGMVLPIRSVLLGEYTSPKNRGGFLATLALGQASGIFLSHLIGSFLSWQRTALVIMFLFFANVVLMMFCPESPSFLASRGRYDECREAFHWLRGSVEDEELEEMIEACLLVEKYKIGDARTQKYSFSEIIETVKKKEFYKPIILTSLLFVFSQFTGASVMANFPIQVMKTLMGEHSKVSFWMVIFDAERIISNLAAVFIVSKVRRRVMMFTTGAICIVCHLCLSAYVYARTYYVFEATWIPVVLVALQVLTIGMGTVPVPGIISGEVFPLEYRGIGASVSVSVLSLALFANLQSFPKTFASIGLEGTYLVYSALMIVTLSLIWFLMPETKDKTLQEIEDAFRGRPLAREEIESRKSLQSNPVYKRKISQRRHSSIVLP